MSEWQRAQAVDVVSEVGEVPAAEVALARPGACARRSAVDVVNLMRRVGRRRQLMMVKVGHDAQYSTQLSRTSRLHNSSGHRITDVLNAPSWDQANSTDQTERPNLVPQNT